MSITRMLVSALSCIVLLGSNASLLHAAGPSAKLNTELKWPKEMYFLAPGAGAVSSALSATGARSSTVNSAAEKERQDQKTDIQKIEDYGIDFKKIVTDAFVKEMQTKGIYDASSSNVLNLKVAMYGYSHKGGFTINMVPMLTVRATLLDANGKKIWKGKGNVSVFGKPVAKADYYELLESKEAAESMFVAAAEKTAAKALKKYK